MTLWESGRQFFYNTFMSTANIKYHGLLNQGATCYLNSVLQVLSMTKDFREAVGRHTCDNPETASLDLHLKALFDDLQRRTANTYEITNKLGIDTVYEQRDAAEYFEKILTLTSPEASQIFHVQLTHNTICSRCETEKTTDAPMWHLPLSLMDSYSKQYSVVDGIEDYFRDSHFSGLDQMYCDQCDDKVDVTIKCEVKHHPEVLVLLLKRFEFDYCYMRYVKNNRFVDVPHFLQIPKNQTYELYAVVDHVGDLRGGHYTATIKCQDDKQWYNFNDASVTLRHNEPVQLNNTEKSQTAYLLFYRKIHATDSCTQNMRNVSTSGGFLPATSDNYDPCRDAEDIGNEVGHDTAETVSVDRHEETGIRGVEPSSDLCHNVEDQNSGGNVRQSEAHKHQECNEGMNDSHDYPQHSHEKQTDEGKMIRDGEDMEGHKETDERETLPYITQPEEKEEDQDNGNTGLDDDRQRRIDNVYGFKLEINNELQIHDPLHKPDELSDAQSRLMHVKTVKDGQTGGDGQSEKPLTENLNRNPEHQVREGLDDVRQNITKDQEGKLKIGRHSDPTHVDVDSRDFNVNTEGAATHNVLSAESSKLLTGNEHVHCDEAVEDQHSRKSVNYSLERVSVEQTEKEDVIIYNIKKDGEHQEHGVERRRTSGRYCGEGLKGQDDVRKNRPQEPLQEDVTCKEKKGDNEHIHKRGNVFLGREGLTGGRVLIENWGEGSEQVRAPEETQPDAQSTSRCVKGDRMGSEVCSKHKRKRIIDFLSCSESKMRRIETVEETSHGSKKRRSQKKSFLRDPATDTLIKGVSRLKIKSHQKKNRNKGNTNIAEENATSIINLSDSEMSELQEQAAATKQPSEKRGEKQKKWQQLKNLLKPRRKGERAKKQREEKKTKHTTPGCLDFLPKKRKEKRKRKT